MPAISRSQMMKELLPGLNAIYGMEYKRYAEEHKDIYAIETSNRSFEEEVKIAGFGAAPVKTEGDRVDYDTAQEAYVSRYRHETIALGFAITEEAAEDNLYDKLSGRYTKALARAMAHTKQTKAVFPLNNAFATTNFTTGDGAALCSSSHVRVDGGSNRNVLTTPTDLGEASLEQAIIDIAAFVDERGLLVAALPRKLIIHPVNQFIATRLLKTEKRPGTADNDVNALITNGFVPGGYAVNHYLSSTTNKNWFITTDVPDGMKHFVRVAMQTGMDGDFDTGNVRYKARERYSFGCSDYMGIFGSGNVT